MQNEKLMDGGGTLREHKERAGIQVAETEIHGNWDYIIDWFWDIASQTLSYQELQAWMVVTGARPSIEEISMLRAMQATLMEAMEKNAGNSNTGTGG